MHNTAAVHPPLCCCNWLPPANTEIAAHSVTAVDALCAEVGSKLQLKDAERHQLEWTLPC